MSHRFSVRTGTALTALVLGLTLFAAPAAAQSWGTVKGQVVFAGKELPKPKEAAVTKDKEHCLGKGPIYINDLIVDPKTKGVRYAIVWLMDAKDLTKPLPIHPKLKEIPAPASIDQPRCAFEPRVVAVREGQKLLLKNSSPIAHNVSLTGRLSMNPLIPSGGQVEIKSVPAGLIPIPASCSIHPWMKGWVASFKHPYFAVTDAAGRFEIKDAPAGDYRLMVWQEAVGWVIINPKDLKDRGRVIHIKANGTTDVGNIPLIK